MIKKKDQPGEILPSLLWDIPAEAYDAAELAVAGHGQPEIKKPSDDRTFTLDDMKKAWLSGFGTASLKGSSGFMKEWFKQRYKITIKD